ncbi:amino acid adenylation domain-containing protein, partial [Rubricella aquisinus]
MDALPLTASGKLDRKALPKPQNWGQRAQNRAAPQGQTERALAAIWAETLGIDANEIARDDSFFALGGHSLTAMRTAARIRDRFQTNTTLAEIFDTPTLKALAEKIAQAPKGTDVSPRPARNEAPLSPVQRGFWALEHLASGTAPTNLRADVILHGALDRARLTDALNRLIARHPMLRARFEIRADGPWQVIDTHAEITLIDGPAGDAPFNLTRAPLLRAHLQKTDTHTHHLTLTVPHLIADGWSAGVIARDLSQLWNRAPLPEVTNHPLGYLTADAPDAGVDYWAKTLEGAPTLALPTDVPRGAAPCFDGATLNFKITAQQQSALMRLAQAQGATGFMAVHAVLTLLLHRYSGDTDIVIGTPIAGRDAPGMEELVGCFINTLALRARIDPNEDFTRHLQQISQISRDAFRHASTPFQQVVEATGAAQDPARHPIYQVLLAYQSMPEMDWQFDELEAEPLQAEVTSATHDLAFVLTPNADGIRGEITYRRDLFHADTIARMARHFGALIDAVTHAPTVPLARLDGLPADATPAQAHAPVTDRTFLDQVRHWVETAPGSTALATTDETLSYSELWEHAGKIAAALTARGIGRGDRVGLLLRRSAAIPILQLAVLRAGAAFVMLDPDHPEGRIAHMIATAQPMLVIADDVDASHVAAPVCHMNDLTGGVAGDPPGAPRPDDLAYLIFTSGTTGQPKAVMVPHRGLANLATAHGRDFALEPGARMLHFASPAFDAAIGETLIPLACGATVVIPDAEERQPGKPLERFIRQQNVTTVTLPPSLLLAMTPEECPSLRVIVAMGEACPQAVIARWAGPERRVINAYGPAENTVCSTLHIATGVDDAPAIGTPLPGVAAYVLDRYMRPVPRGAVGELFLGGIAVALGYLGQAGQSAAAFRPDPFSATPGTRMYATGDRVRMLGNGALMFVGRADDQISLRGFRIEPAEISAALRACAGVMDAVITRVDTPRPMLVAYVTGDAGLSLSAIEPDLLRHLPRYMIPQALVRLERFPVTPNGKIDMAALPAPRLDDDQADAPQTAEETAVWQVWRGILGTQTIGRASNFFGLGGDSITAIQVVAGLEARGYRCAPKDVFTFQTLAALAQALTPIEAATTAPLSDDRPLPLSPMQAWYLDSGPSDPNHFVQTIVLDTPAEPEAVRAALEDRVAAHPAFGLRFRQMGGAWQQHYAGPGSLGWITGGNATLEDLGRDLRALIDIEDGPVIAATTQPGRLILTAHHLVIDAVSWRILLQEVSDLLSGATPPQPSTALLSWLREDHIAPPIPAERQSLPMDRPHGTNTYGDVTRRQAALDQAQTTALLTEATRPFGITAEELILAGCARAVARWAGRDALSMDVERHGRTDGALSGAIGWFTHVAPIHLPCPDDPVEQIIAAKEGLRRPAAPQDAANILFNYFGVLDTGPSNLPFTVTDLSAGPERAPGDPRDHLIEMSAHVREGQLHLSLSYAAAQYDDLTPLAEACLAEVRSLVATAIAQEATHQTPSDFPHVTVSRAHLEHITATHGPIDDILPLTPLQSGMLADSLRHKDSTARVEQVQCRLQGPLDPEHFFAAWRAVFHAEPALRGRIETGGEEPLLVIVQQAEPIFDLLDWSGKDAEKALTRRAQDQRRPDAPPHHITLAKTAEDDWLFLWTSDHIFLDGWSLPLILRAVFTAYVSGAAPVPRVTLSDYAHHTPDRAADTGFWAKALAGITAPTDLPFDAPLSAQGIGSDTLSLTLSAEETDAATQFAREAGITLATLMNGVWAIVLSQISGAPSVVFGTTLSGRPETLPGADEMVGMFINTLPLRADLSPDAPLVPWLQEVQMRAADLRARQHDPLPDVIAAAPDLDGPTLFHSAVVYENYPVDPTLMDQVAGLTISDVTTTEESHFPLTLLVAPGPVMGVKLHYKPSLFSSSTASSLLSQFIEGLRGVVGGVGCVGDVVLEGASGAALGVGPERAAGLGHLLGGIAEQAAAAPDRAALRFDGTDLSYHAFVARGERLARVLVASGVARGDAVGIAAERGFELMIGLYAILRAGAAYVPLDSDMPVARLRMMLEDSGARTVLSGPGCPTGLLRDEAEISLSGWAFSPLNALPDGPAFARAITPEDLAYILFTSGSTGRPKGVMVSHGAIDNRLVWMQEAFELSPIDRVLLKTPIGFDVSVWELFWALREGATLVIAAPGGHRDGSYLADLIEKERITHIHFVPAMLQAFVETPRLGARCASLRRIICSGEALTTTLAKEAMAATRSPIVNLYGPTEAAVDV